MRRSKSLLVALTIAGTAALALVPAAANASTSVTFTVSSGTLSIAEPSAQANLGSATATALGTTVSGALGSTTVTDNRGSLAGWTVTMTGSDFSDGATPTPDTIAANQAVAWVSSVPTPTSGVAVVSTTYLTAATGLTLTTSGQTFMTATTTGSNVVSYNPNLQVTIPSTAVAGTYTGTITQTVA